MNSPIVRYAPWIAAGLATLFFAGMAIPPRPKSGEMNLYEFGKIPVQQGGRIKPIDTVARVSLTIVSERSEYEDTNDKKQLAIRWLLESMTSEDNGRNGAAAKLKVFRIDHDQILQLFRLERRPGSYRYSMDEINANRFRLLMKMPDDKTKEISRLQASELMKAGRDNEVEFEDKLQNEVKRVKAIKSEDDRDVYDRRILQLQGNLNLYQELASRQGPTMIPPIREGSDEWLPLKAIDEHVTRRALAQLDELSARGAIDLSKMADFEKYHFAIELRKELLTDLSPAAAKFEEILIYYRANNVEGFNNAVKEYRGQLQKLPASDLAKSNFEAFFNHFAPFYQCSVMYLLIIVIGCGAWLGYQEPLRRSAFALTIVTLVAHTFAILGRMYIQDRPPVTNLYSSAVFIGWGCVLLCLVLERIFRNGIGNVVGAVLGAVTMMIAHRLSESGDTLEMLQAVLDTNLWLATHVTCVTMGYTATFVSGLIGVVYVVRGLFTKSLDSANVKIMGSMMYGVVCFAMLLSFTGTVLGGIWGDQSWGRFWGWDPKENGAVLVVIMNALILHARWCGLVRQRGMALLTIVGIMVTFWSWFGTNQLGVGLHAYGFSKELALICRYVWLGCLGLIGIGLLPTKYWRSFSEATVRQRTQQATTRLNQEKRNPRSTTAGRG